MINVELSALPQNVEKVVFVASIYDADVRGQNFGQVANAYIRLVDRTTNREIARFDLSEDYSMETALTFGELTRNSGGWNFSAVGQGTSGGLAQIAVSYGLQVQ